MIKRTFRFLGFVIEISSNIKIANFLEVTLNLSDNSYRPFLKTNQYPSYIDVNPNHPSSIIKQVPKLLIREQGDYHQIRKFFMKIVKCILKPLRIVVLKKSLLI